MIRHLQLELDDLVTMATPLVIIKRNEIYTFYLHKISRFYLLKTVFLKCANDTS